MADEATITASIVILKQDSATSIKLINYAPQALGFRADVSGVKGPTPGSFTVTTSGTNVDLDELTTPGLCRFVNQDATNFVEFGIWNGANFFPLGEIRPGEGYVLRLSRNLFYGESGTASVNSLRFRANTASVVVTVEAFEA